MIIDARTLPRDHVLHADVCIVGAGPAGITIALELAGGPQRVVLLESGGDVEDRAARALSVADQVGVGRPVHRTRRRCIGGTSAAWLGWCRPLDPIDFEARPWVPLSGWPFDRAHLDPYYARAHRWCELPPYDYEPATFASADRPVIDGGPDVETHVFHFSPPTHFGAAYRDRLTRAENVTLCSHATVTSVAVNETASAATGVRCVAGSGEPFRVEAKTVVLAAGGIENPRLLLLSNQVQREGLGNSRGWVGRCFMEHAYFFSGVLTPTPGGPPVTLYRCRRSADTRAESDGVTATWALGERVQRKEALLGCAVHLTTRPWHKTRAAFNSPAGVAAGAWVEALAAGETPEHWRHGLASMLGNPADLARLVVDKACDTVAPRSVLAVRACAESAPDPENRVTLGERRDPLGLPRASVVWRPGEAPLRSLRCLHEALSAALGREGVASLDWRVTGRDGGWPATLIGGAHHMGTTRMSRDAATGVVDADGQVHGVAGLFVAGSSVFPTAGYANPTLTLVALAVRLADRLRQIHC